MSDTITIVGQIKGILEAKIFGTNFEVREFWVEEIEGQYPQTFSIQATQGKCNILDNFKAGDVVEVKCNLRGRYWQKEEKEGVMNSIQMWQIQKVNAQPTQQFAPNQGYNQNQAQQEYKAVNTNNSTQFTPVTNQPDDLPF